MIFPFESLSGDHRTLGLAFAVLSGFLFGFVLERAGFGQARKLVGQFYGTDLTVFKVMFGAIVTAMLGTVILSGVGLLDMQLVLSRYPTFLWPMVAGGFLLGVGFVVSGYCPGTSIVATASGKLDGLATVGGVVVGSVLYSELLDAIPALARFHGSSAMGPFSLERLFGMPGGAVAVLVVAIALVAFLAGERIERALSGRAAPDPAPRTVVFVSLALFAAAALSTVLVPGALH